MKRLLVCLLFAACALDTASIDQQVVDPAVPWQMTTILYGLGANPVLKGADGVAINASGDVLAPWEQTAKTTISKNPGCALADQPWPYITLPGTTSGSESAIYADVDGDGYQDVVVFGSAGKRIYVYFGTAAGTYPTQTIITVASNVQLWLNGAVADFDGDGHPDIIAGPEGGAQLYKFSSATPRVGTSWTMTAVAAVTSLWTIEVHDWNADGRPDLVVTDSQHNPGVFWLENTPTGWVKHVIATVLGSRWAYVNPDRFEVAHGYFDGVHNHQGISSSVDGIVWTYVDIPSPTNTGQFNAIVLEDMDGDGVRDAVITYNHAIGDLSGVVLLKGPTWDRYEVSGPLGEKFDNLVLVDLDCSGKKAVLTNEQGRKGDLTIPQLGNVQYKNPF